MAIKTILAPIGGTKSSLKALDRAFVIAERFGAHIKALHVMERVSDAVSFEFHLPAKLRGSVQESAEQAALSQADQYREMFEAACAKAGIALSDTPTKGDSPSAGWVQEFGHVEEVLIRHARLSDVVTVPRPSYAGGPSRRSPAGRAIEAILCGTGRPVLIEPPDVKVERVTSVAIGWNESTEASRAVAMTLPWLTAMGAVTVISSKKRSEGAKAMVEYLSWHGAVANVAYLDGKGSGTGDAILNVCAEGNVGMLVVGGFSHARARELLFGGVTRHLLAHTNIPTVLVH